MNGLYSPSLLLCNEWSNYFSNNWIRSQILFKWNGFLAEILLPPSMDLSGPWTRSGPRWNNIASKKISTLKNSDWKTADLELLKNSDRRKNMTFEYFKNQPIVCSSDKIMSKEVVKNKIKYIISAPWLQFCCIWCLGFLNFSGQKIVFGADDRRHQNSSIIPDKYKIWICDKEEPN